MAASLLGGCRILTVALMCFYKNLEALRKMPFEHIRYTHKYFLDDEYEYRQVILPDHIAKFVPRTHLLSETEWRNMGVCQSPGWIHYMIHPRDRHVLLFRRLRTSNNDPANTESAISSTLN